MNFSVSDIIVSKKNHACGQNRWQIIRVGADYKIKCLNCGRIVMLTFDELKKITKKIEKGVDGV